MLQCGNISSCWGRAKKRADLKLNLARILARLSLKMAKMRQKAFYTSRVLPEKLELVSLVHVFPAQLAVQIDSPQPTPTVGSRVSTAKQSNGRPNFTTLSVMVVKPITKSEFNGHAFLTLLVGKLARKVTGNHTIASEDGRIRFSLFVSLPKLCSVNHLASILLTGQSR